MFRLDSTVEELATIFVYFLTSRINSVIEPVL